MTALRLVALSLTAGLAACAVGPDYQAPTAELAPSFYEGTADPIGEATAQYWWRSYDDAMLNDLVSTGLSQNLDIQTALARVDEAQAAARATGVVSQVSGPLSANTTQSGGEGRATDTTSSRSFSPSLLIDLFGSERRSREQALAQLQAAELSVGEARLAFLSSIVTNYIDLRYYQEALAVTRQTIESRGETLSLVQAQRSAGTATELDFAQAQAALDSSRATLPSLESGFYAATYAIATLLAEPVQSISARLERGAAQPYAGGSASIGVPADLLRNRPDLRGAERDYAAAVAAVGVSEAALYPSISLGGTVTASDDSTWSFGPSVTFPILSQGALNASRSQAVAQAEQARLTWRATVLAAVEDVQTAQSDYLRNRRAVDAYRQTVASYEQVVDLSRQTYQSGTTTLLDLLDAQRSLSSAKLSLASGLRDLAASWATLQVSGGLGWRMPTATKAI